jgi:Transposase DDE domain group 1
MHEATQQWKQTNKPARVFSEFLYQTKKTKKGGWEKERRVAAKAEHIDGKENPRFVVTSLKSEQWGARALYEELYCGRGDMENRIKEQFSLFADRVSTETMRGNQMRVYLSAMAYVLVSGLRRVGLKGTELAEAQVSTIRTKLLKIGSQIRMTVRKVWISMASSYPWQDLYGQVWANLRC